MRGKGIRANGTKAQKPPNKAMLIAKAQRRASWEAGTIARAVFDVFNGQRSFTLPLMQQSRLAAKSSDQPRHLIDLGRASTRPASAACRAVTSRAKVSGSRSGNFERMKRDGGSGHPDPWARRDDGKRRPRYARRVAGHRGGRRAR